MEDNQILTRKLILTTEQADDKPATLLSEWLSQEQFLYSYLVKCKLKDGVPNQYIIQVSVSQIERYNTVSIPEAVLSIVDSIHNGTKEYVIGYQQPPIEVMCEAFTPLVYNLANRMSKMWNQELDDMVQMCYLCMVTLYNKGYYLNKSLLTTTFVRQVVCAMRKVRTAMRRGYKGTVSLDSLLNDADGITVMDTIEDERQEKMLTDFEDEDESNYEFSRKKKAVIDSIGKRKYKSLVTDYENKTVSQSDRTYIYKLGKKLRKRND